MKKYLTLFIFVLFGFCAFIASAHAAIVTLNPGDNIQAVVNANPAGTTYQLSAGMYRMQAVVPKTEIFSRGHSVRGEHD